VGYYQRRATADDKKRKKPGKKKKNEKDKDGKADQEQGKLEDEAAAATSKFKFSVDGKTWVRGDSDAHLDMIDAYMDKCENKKPPRYCWP